MSSVHSDTIEMLHRKMMNMTKEHRKEVNRLRAENDAYRQYEDYLVNAELPVDLRGVSLKEENNKLRKAYMTLKIHTENQLSVLRENSKKHFQNEKRLETKLGELSDIRVQNRRLADALEEMTLMSSTVKSKVREALGVAREKTGDLQRENDKLRTEVTRVHEYDRIVRKLRRNAKLMSDVECQLAQRTEQRDLCVKEIEQLRRTLKVREDKHREEISKSQKALSKLEGELALSRLALASQRSAVRESAAASETLSDAESLLRDLVERNDKLNSELDDAKRVLGRMKLKRKTRRK